VPACSRLNDPKLTSPGGDSHRTPPREKKHGRTGNASTNKLASSARKSKWVNHTDFSGAGRTAVPEGRFQNWVGNERPGRIPKKAVE